MNHTTSKGRQGRPARRVDDAARPPAGRPGLGRLRRTSQAGARANARDVVDGRGVRCMMRSASSQRRHWHAESYHSRGPPVGFEIFEHRRRGSWPVTPPPNPDQRAARPAQSVLRSSSRRARRVLLQKPCGHGLEAERWPKAPRYRGKTGEVVTHRRHRVETGTMARSGERCRSTTRACTQATADRDGG